MVWIDNSLLIHPPVGGVEDTNRAKRKTLWTDRETPLHCKPGASARSWRDGPVFQTEQGHRCTASRRKHSEKGNMVFGAFINGENDSHLPLQ